MKEPNLEEIVKARNQCARIISIYGERYLPIFERLEKEIELRRYQQKLLEKALVIGTQNSTQNGTQGTEPNFELAKKFNEFR